MGTEELLPTEYLIERFHRITISDKAFEKLRQIRAKHRLWDREASILFLIDFYEEYEIRMRDMRIRIRELERTIEQLSKK